MSSQDVLVVAETNRGQVADIIAGNAGHRTNWPPAREARSWPCCSSADGAAFAEALSAADRILLVNDPLLAGFSPKPYLAVLESVVKTESPRVVLLGSTSIGLDIGPLLGAKLCPVINGCRSASVAGDTLKVTASFYGGKLLADVAVTAAPAILLVAPGAFQPAESKGAAQVETKQAPCLWTPARPRSRK